ncbi:MAG: lactate racemase domain-containing protein [Planctomycetales bacterium]
MSLARPAAISLAYGTEGRFSCEIDPGRIVGQLAAPRPTPRFAEELRTALARPLDFPAMEQAVVPGDVVCVALDQATPEAAAIVSELWRVFEMRGVSPDALRIVQPPTRRGHAAPDPREALPADVRREVSWTIHDPEARSQQAYLASVASGERIYLAREVIDADFLVSVGPLAFDPLLGYRGTNSVYFPGLSSGKAVGRARGQGHVELGPDDERPLRQLIDEIAWLLGVMFTVQVVPARGAGAARVLAGAPDSVLQLGKHYLAADWLIELESRPEMVVAAIDADAGGHHWGQVGAALDAARNLVAREGKIVLLSEISELPDGGMGILAASESPADAFGPLREAAPPDLVEATQLCNALEWADVYFLSRLESDRVDDLFMVPLADEREVARLLGRDESCAVLESAQHAYGRIRC